MDLAEHRIITFAPDFQSSGTHTLIVSQISAMAEESQITSVGVATNAVDDGISFLRGSLKGMGRPVLWRIPAGL